MQKRKKITEKTDMVITVILWLIVFVMALIALKSRNSDWSDKIWVFIAIIINVLLLVVFLNKAIKRHQKYTIKNKAIREWVKKNLKITEIKETWVAVWWEWNERISTEYQVIVEDKDQIYISSWFYVKNIDEYAKVWDNINVYIIKWERLNYYIDLNSITPGNWLNDNSNKREIKESKNKIREKAWKSIFWESFTAIMLWLFLIMFWVILVYGWELFWLLIIAFWWFIAFSQKNNSNKYDCINKWEEVTWIVESIEETKWSRWWIRYIVNVKANWRIYRSEAHAIKPGVNNWDKISVFIDRSDYNKYYVYIADNTEKYFEEKRERIEETLKENPSALYFNPIKVLKDTEKTEDKKDWIKKEETLEEKYPYLSLPPKNNSILRIVIKNFKNFSTWWVIALIWYGFACWWELIWLAFLLFWWIILYPIIYKIYEYNKQENLTKIGVKKLTKISRIEMKKDIFYINIKSVKENDRHDDSEKENEAKYYYIIYTTDWNKEYKSFKVKNPFVKVWDPLYVYIDPDNEKSYWVDTSNISFDVMDFFTKILWSIFPWL